MIIGATILIIVLTKTLSLLKLKAILIMLAISIIYDIIWLLIYADVYFFFCFIKFILFKDYWNNTTLPEFDSYSL